MRWRQPENKDRDGDRQIIRIKIELKNEDRDRDRQKMRYIEVESIEAHSIDFHWAYPQQIG